MDIAKDPNTYITVFSCVFCISLPTIHDGRYPWITRWRHQMETFSALLALCAGNSLVTGELPSQRPETRNFDVLFDLSLKKRLSKQSRRWWCETASHPLWRHCNEFKQKKYIFVINWNQSLYFKPYPNIWESWTKFIAQSHMCLRFQM